MVGLQPERTVRTLLVHRPESAPFGVAFDESVCEPCEEETPAAPAMSEREKLAERMKREQQPIAWATPRLPADQHGWRGDSKSERSAMWPYDSYGRWVEARTGRTDHRTQRPVEYVSRGDIVRGMWTCCQQVAPNTLGCLTGPHAFDSAQCAQCGDWVPLQDWAKSTCRYHHKPPKPMRWGAAEFPCCGVIGLHGTKYMNGKPLTRWLTERNRDVRHQMAAPGARTGSAKPQRHLEISGCVVGAHMPVMPPEGVALRCAGCGNEASDARCDTCAAVLQQCMQARGGQRTRLALIPHPANTLLSNLHLRHVWPRLEQCFQMVPVLPANNSDINAPQSRPDRPPLAHACRFHPGSWSAVRSTRFASGQRREGLLCPHEGCGLRLQTVRHREHADRCEYGPVLCPNGCDQPDGSQTIIRHKDTEDHLEICPDYPVTCPNVACGCAVTIRAPRSSAEVD